MKTNVGIIINDAEALRVYTAATGELPPAIPTGCNTVEKSFVVDGRAALIVKQRGFSPLRGETQADVNGYTVLIALDAPDLDAGRAAIEEAVRRIEGKSEGN